MNCEDFSACMVAQESGNSAHSARCKQDVIYPKRAANALDGIAKILD
jgi:hypothetical protein